MGDRPGQGSLARDMAGGLDFHWSGDRGVTQTPRPVDNTRPGDRPVQTQNGVVELSYNDPNFDRKLWDSKATSLRIKDFPQGVAISSWVDNNGFFMWYRGGADNKAHHYLPPGLKTIEVGNFKQDVDEMRINASLSAMKEADRSQQGFTSVNERTDPLTFAKRMGSLGWDQLQMQEKTLRQAADASPNNPYFRLYLCDILVAEAFKPVMDQVASGKDRIELNTPFTQQKMNEAAQEALKAEQIAQRVGGARYPNTTQMPGLSPFHLNPYSYNPDMYWSGALYQGYRREAQIRLLQTYIQQFSTVELPPALPGR